MALSHFTFVLQKVPECPVLLGKPSLVGGKGHLKKEQGN
jgi:hypothetical protein